VCFLWGRNQSFTCYLDRWHEEKVSSKWYFCFSPVSIIPPTPHTYLHIHVAGTRRTNGRSLGMPSKSRTISDIGRAPDTNCFHSVHLQRLNILSNSAVGHNFLKVQYILNAIYIRNVSGRRGIQVDTNMNLSGRSNLLYSVYHVWKYYTKGSTEILFYLWTIGCTLPFFPCTVMRRITTFRSTTDRIYDGGLIIL